MQCKAFLITSGFGFLVLFATSLFLLLWIPGYIDDEIHRQIKDYVTLRPGKAKASYDRFVSEGDEDGESYYTHFYFFNITNLAEVQQDGAKPILQECGPYVYRTESKKRDIAFYWNGSITYKERTFYYPEPSMTNGNINDTIVTANMPLIGVLKRIYGLSSSWLLRLTMSRIASAISSSADGLNEGLFVGRTVDELLWGYEDPLLDTISILARRWITVSSTFSLMLNGSDDSPNPDTISMINSGSWNLSKIGQMELYDGLNATQNWNNYSEAVRGTAGTFFKPFISDEEELTIWAPQMYRSMKIKKGGKAKMLGINVHRYYIDPAFWRPDDRFFDTYRGLVNVTGNSAGGSPGPYLFFSPPHFCGADPNLTNAVIGVECKTTNKDDGFFIDVEPYTGISLRGAIRFMISTQYSAEFPDIEPNLTKTVLPVFSLSEERKATWKQTSKIRDDLYEALDLKDILRILFIVLCVVSGLFMILLWGYVLWMIRLERSLTPPPVVNKLDEAFTAQWREDEVQEPILPHSNNIGSHPEVQVE